MKKIRIPPSKSDEIILWLDENKIEYEPIDRAINPYTLGPMIAAISIKNEKDYVFYMLRWT